MAEAHPEPLAASSHLLAMALAQLEFYADLAVAAAASAAYSTAWSWGQFGEYDAPDDELGLLDDDRLAAVGHGLDVPEAAFLVSVAEVVPQGNGFIECPVVRHGLCCDARQVNHETIVPASAYGSTVLTSTSDINGAGRQHS